MSLFLDNCPSAFLVSTFPTSSLLSKRAFDFSGFLAFQMASSDFILLGSLYRGLFFTPSYGGLQYTGIYWHFATSLLFARQTADARYQPSPCAETLYQIKTFLLSWFPRPD